MVKRRWFTSVLAAIIIMAGLLPALQPTTVRAEPFADPTFNSLWNVTDSLVANGAVKRTWFWGPTPGFISHERYDQAPASSRLVQYFEKGRMEINNPNGDRTSPFFVTGGLLVLDMVTGNQQVGDNSYLPRTPSTQIVAGDGGDAAAPTYASFRSVTSMVLGSNHLPANLGGFATSVLAANGAVTSDASKATDPQAQIVAYSDIFGHNIPRAMWDFMNAIGPIMQGGTVVQNQPIINWIFTLGYPISDAYWAHVHIGGQPADVLIQLFQRRTLVYAPSLPAGFRLQMGNVGSHYYNWLYTSNFTCPTGLNCTGAQPTVTPTTPPAPALPPNIDASINPSSGPAGTRFTVNVTKMSAGENVAAWTTRLRDNVVTPLPDPSQTADGNGNISGLTVDSTGFSDGTYAVTYYGRSSKHSAVAYFAIGAAAPTNTPAPAPTNTPGAPAPTNTPAPPPPGPDCSGIPAPQSASVSPNCGSPGDTFTFSFFGFTPNESVSFWFTDPHGNVVGTANPLTGSPNGRFDNLSIPTQSSFGLGIWALTFHGSQSGHESIAWFKLVPRSGGQPSPTPGGANVSISPAAGDVNTTFTVNASGFQAGERIGIWFTDPNQRVFYPQNGSNFNADNAGNFSIQFRPADTFTILTGGVWSFTAQGVTSGKQAITHFTLNR
jgi:hypothetical protein